jgi:AhpD family alkylhydroperoxidase
MTQRIPTQTLLKLQPAVAQNLLAIGEAAEKSGLERNLLHLVKLRASQINGCAYCVNMHSRDARKLGESQERLDLVPVWREAPCFSARERAALEWTEALTLIARDHVPDGVYDAAKAPFSDAEFAGLTAAIVAINGWNRILSPFRADVPVKAA